MQLHQLGETNQAKSPIRPFMFTISKYTFLVKSAFMVLSIFAKLCFFKLVFRDLEKSYFLTRQFKKQNKMGKLIKRTKKYPEKVYCNIQTFLSLDVPSFIYFFKIFFGVRCKKHSKVKSFEKC